MAPCHGAPHAARVLGCPSSLVFLVTVSTLVRRGRALLSFVYGLTSLLSGSYWYSQLGGVGVRVYLSCVYTPPTDLRFSFFPHASRSRLRLFPQGSRARRYLGLSARTHGVCASFGPDRGQGFALHISVHLLLVTYGLAMGTFHAVVGSSHPPGARLVPYLEVACGLCAPAISSARDSTPTHLLLW